MAMNPVPMIEGLSSPGPAYALPSSFDKASAKAHSQTFGRAGKRSIKNSRTRVGEVRYISERHSRELRGHFSPGPRYGLPSTLGGSTAPWKGSSMDGTQTQSKRGAKYAYPPQQTKRGVAQWRNSRPQTNSQIFGRPSPASPKAKPEPRATADINSVMPNAEAAGSIRKGPAFWRVSTTLQKHEDRKLSTLNRNGASLWHEEPALEASILQEIHELKLQRRNREVPEVPNRQTIDQIHDPPFATVFGVGGNADHFGMIGGRDLQWRESKVTKYGAPGIKFGAPNKHGALRCAFVQPEGTNSVDIAVRLRPQAETQPLDEDIFPI